ncbi:Glutathione amide reductase [Fundidesulfovibrio magnetotacticus]|uniref:Glutathione amide reductase n=1 Tax=Fundidesulfovibrio magnetotacticus TaxID=2730080 RepID=A0A6V8LLB5_9BACT|nr:NAD(P)/FAD-dependent oxidoreductase [Fundidesulfovibrio magnetotacticus]GFK93463.1 Glutathione amide reductase [Fundidesulfovibrio magnetotacticus]
MSPSYDVLVIGSGAAGATAARILVKAGRSVALAEGGDFGGTCALRGCEPKKVLAETAHAVARAREMGRRNGVRGQLSVSWPELAALKQSYVDSVPPRAEASLEMAGIDLYHGRARFTGTETLLVDGQELSAGHILLATGSRPHALDIPGAELLATSDDFLNLKELPGRILFLGGGYIALEFAQIAAIAGARVTVAARGDRLLRRFEPEMVEALLEASRELGVEILTGAPPRRVERTASGLAVRLENGATLEADLVVNGSGRVPDLDGLDLDAAGIESRNGRLVLDPFLKTTNPKVYAAGDAAGIAQLTPTAVMEAKAVAANILEGDHVRPDHSLVPSCVFTHPPLAAVGLTEAQARAAGVPFEVRQARDLTWPELTRLGIRRSGYKLLLEPDGGRLLGIAYLGEAAAEVANQAMLVMRLGLRQSEIMDIAWAYPSFGYALRYMLS